MKNLQKIYEYLFAPWEITMIEESSEEWRKSDFHQWCGFLDYKRDYVKYLYFHKFRREEWRKSDFHQWCGFLDYKRDYVKYLYSHKFRREEKIVKKYLN